MLLNPLFTENEDDSEDLAATRAVNKTLLFSQSILGI